MLEVLTAAAKVLGSLAAAKSAFDPESSGGGGGVSATTQSGQGGIAFTPVGIETLEISPFEYMEMQREFEQEQGEAEQMRYGGPLYAADGEPIEGEPLTPEEEEKRNRERMLMIMSMLSRNRLKRPQMYNNLSAPMEEKSFNDQDEGILSLRGFNNSKVEEEIPRIEVEGEKIEPEIPGSEERLEELEQWKKEQARKDTFETVEGTLKQLAELRKLMDSGKSSIKGRGNIVPGAKGGRAYRQQRQETTSQGITPFQYRAMQGGGALNRQMFMQNYMPNGGDIRGPGGPKDDLIPVMASNGEYMLSKAAVDQAGGGNHAKGIANLEQFNDRGNRRYG